MIIRCLFHVKVKVEKSLGWEEKRMSYLITPETLYEQMKKEEIVIIDVRSNLQNPDAGLELYRKQHLPGAYYLHLEKDLSGEVKKHGGNHPLPDIEELAQKLGEMGINHHKKVVIYDANNDMFAPRAWWLLHYLGHEQSYVLDGGFAAWEHNGYTLTEEIPQSQPTTFIPRLRQDIIVSIDEVKLIDKDRSVLIDSRAKERYLGHTEPLYRKAGHIPGAKNFFWKEVLDEQGNWKGIDRLQNHFAMLMDKDEIIVSCGSGISACPNYLALKMAGFHNVKLYPGSYSDWISYEENPVETREE